MIHRYFDDPFIYGPITEEEFSNLTVNHRTSVINGERYIGVVSEIREFRDRTIVRPIPQEREPEQAPE